MTVKRKIQASDLNHMASVDPHELDMFVPAMVKAMLNSPMEYTGGQSFSIFFQLTDINSIRAGGKITPSRYTRMLWHRHKKPCKPIVGWHAQLARNSYQTCK